MVRLGAQNKPPRAALGAKVTWQQIRTFYSSTDQGGGKAAVGHSISRFFRRLSPFPFAGVPVVAGNTALDHFIAHQREISAKRAYCAMAKVPRKNRQRKMRGPPFGTDVTGRLSNRPALLSARGDVVLIP